MFRNVTLLLWIGFYLRLCVAAWNGFVAPSFGAEGDASTFNMIAVIHSHNLDIDKLGLDSKSIYYPLNIGWMYPYVLGVFYKFITPSLFLGCFLSVVAWGASAFILVRIMRLLSFDMKNQFKVMLIYVLLPSSILHTSVTLREPYQLLFVNLAIYAFLKIYMNKSLSYLPVFLCTVLCMSILHGVLLVFGVFIVTVALFMLSFRNYQSARFLSVIKLIMVLPLIAYVVSYGMDFFNVYSYGNYAGGADLSWHYTLECFQNGLVSVGGGARSNFKSSVVLNSGVDLLYFVPVGIFQYLFEPMPWRITNSFDIFVMLENILRAWLLWRAWIWFRSVSVQGKGPVFIVFISYLLLEALWSLGTVNWGNAVRHHIPSVGLMLIVGFAYMRVPHSKKAKQIK